MPRRGQGAVSGPTQQLFEAKLASSGLDLDDATELGMYPTDPAATASLSKGFDAKPGLVIPYFDALGGPRPDVPGAAQFMRVRYLGEAATFRDATKGETLRYTQPVGTINPVYLPRITDWGDILPDASCPVIITEGELKAAAACKLGFPTIGLGGVWNFRAIQYGYTLLPDLAEFEWLRRQVYIMFDSDAGKNQQVMAAAEELAKELGQHGAFIHLAWLPEVLGNGVKVGLDDFIVHEGEAAEEKLTVLLHDADAVGIVKPLLDLNERYVYVSDPGLIIDQRTQAKHKPAALREHLEATKTSFVRKPGKTGDDKRPQYDRVAAGAEWLRWPLRNEVERITYMPGKGRFIVNGHRLYNTWDGWGIEPAKGDVAPFVKLIDHLFTRAEAEAKTWFLRWLAYPLQYPGVKMYSSAAIHGRRHGTGKSLVGYTMGRIYGKNFTGIKQDDLHGNFNEWAERKQFVLGDDVTGSNKREDADVLKKLITQEMMRVNPKYVPSYEVPDCINYFFSSNQPDAFFLEDDDRRFFIHEVLVGPLDEQFYVDYGLWLDSGGSAAVFDWLLHLDLGDFNPAAPALMTDAKRRMISDVRSDLGSWARRLLEDPDSVLRVGDVVVRKELFTNKELLQFYDPTGHTGTTANGLGRELRRAGVIQVLAGQPVRSKFGLDRYYAIRRGSYWESAKADEVVRHINDAVSPTSKFQRY